MRPAVDHTGAGEPSVPNRRCATPIPLLLAPLIPAFLTAFAQGAGTTAGAAVIQALMPKPRDPAKVSAELAQANQSLADALNRINTPSPSPDALWQAGDAMQWFAKEQPDYLAQAQEAIRDVQPSQLRLRDAATADSSAGGRAKHACPVVARSIGPKPTEPSSAQLFALPEINELRFPKQIETVQWPQATKFVWPERIQLPTEPASSHGRARRRTRSPALLSSTIAAARRGAEHLAALSLRGTRDSVSSLPPASAPRAQRKLRRAWRHDRLQARAAATWRIWATDAAFRASHRHLFPYDLGAVNVAPRAPVAFGAHLCTTGHD